MISQVDELAMALEAFHISAQQPKKSALRKSSQQPKKSVRWAPGIVDNNGKSRFRKEIRGLKRVLRDLNHEYDNLRHSWDETKCGFIPEEYKHTKFSTSSEIFADILVRLNELISKKAACNDHINMRLLAMEWTADRSSHL